MVLVMDDVATRTISSVLGMYDIMEARVTLVEQLARARQPFREMEVIYLITPSEESVAHVLNDFQSEAKATYGDVHLFFLSPVSFLLLCLQAQRTHLIVAFAFLVDSCDPNSSPIASLTSCEGTRRLSEG